MNVTYEPIEHKGQARIAVHFNFNKIILNRLKTVANPVYSVTKKLWHVADTEKMRTLFKLPLKQSIEINLRSEAIEVLPEKPKVVAQIQHKLESNKIHPINAHCLPKLLEALQLKGYSSSTQRTYVGEVAVFLNTIGAHEADSFTAERIKKYLHYCIAILKLSENTIHSRFNAIKFYYEKVLQQEELLLNVPRPKKHQSLPKVISEEKVLSVIFSVGNQKHQAILLLAYSAGLRVSEVVKLKIEDIDKDRMQIFISRGKGKKDRIVPLSPIVLEVLRAYFKLYKPVYWLFEGHPKEYHYSERSAQEIFKEACKKINLPKHFSFHSLRHSYATHLLENGTDIAYIQKLLGHNQIKTTLIYTQVRNDNQVRIASPLDTIMNKLGYKTNR